MMNLWTMNFRRLCMSYEIEVYDEKVILDECIKVVVELFLAY